MLPLIQSGVFDVYTSTQQRDIVSDERSRGMEVDRGSAAVLCNSMRWVCVRLCVLASPAALRWDTLSGRIWVLFEPVKTATGLHTHQTLAPSLPSVCRHLYPSRRLPSCSPLPPPPSL